MKILNIFFRLTITIVLVFIISLILSNFWIISSTKNETTSFIGEIRETPVALVLGTSRSVNGKDENPFFTLRMKAAADLFHAGKVKHFILSGDNSTKLYNEPRDMRLKLIRLGVPSSAITLDFAGRRTLDSVIRCKKIFNQNNIIIISQEFHNYRAVFIAKYFGMKVQGFNANFPENANNKIIFREYLARPKALLDLYILKTKPAIMGDTLNINV